MQKIKFTKLKTCIYYYAFAGLSYIILFMKRIIKYLELVFLGFVNVFFSAGLFFLTYIFSLFYKDGENFDKNIVLYLIFVLFIWLIFLFIKLFTFFLIYWLRPLLPNIHKILFKIKTVKRFRIKYLLYVLLLDISIFIIMLFANNLDFRIFFPYLLSAGGVLPCYVIFIILLKLFKPVSYLFKIKK